MKLLKGNRNQCQTCKEYFNSNTPFDKHRTGEHGVNRRCRTPDEMLALGMSLNADGFWVTEKMPDRMKRRTNEDHHSCEPA
jgi:NAD-dependent SIR2 family protein deacetylase